MKKQKLKLKKYAFGDFVADQKKVDKLSGGISTGANLLGSAIGNNDVGSALTGAGTGLATGVKLGSTFGPYGAVIGGAVGTIAGGISGLIGSNKRQEMLKQNEARDSVLQQNAYNQEFNANLDTNNQNAYGNIGQFADGGDIDPDKPVTKVPAKKFYAKYMSSPIYQERLNKAYIADKPNIQNVLSAHISEVPGAGSFGQDELSSYFLNESDAGFPIIKGKSNINIDRSQAKYLSKQYPGTVTTPEQILSHELSHISRPLRPQEQLMIGSMNKSHSGKSLYKDYLKSDKKLNYIDFISKDPRDNHDNTPDENKADLDAIRYMMFKKGIYDTSKRDMTLDDFNKASKDKEINKSSVFQRLNSKFKPEDLIWMNNNIASSSENDNTNQKFAEGGEVPKKGKRPLNPADQLTNLYAQNPQMAPTYNGTPEGQFITEHADGSMGRWGKDYNLLPNEVVPLPSNGTPPILLSDKALGTDNTYNARRNQQQNNNIPIIKSPTGRNRYADGGNVEDPQVPKKVGGLYDKNKTAYVDSVLNANKNLDWVQRLTQKNTPSIQVSGEKYRSTHLMRDNGQGYVYPSVVNIDGNLTHLPTEDEAESYARKTNTGIQLPQQQGTWFAGNGYKQGTGVLKQFSDGGDIHIKSSHRGRFTEYKERTGKTTEEALHSSDPHVRQMANFARNAAKWKHENGDEVEMNNQDNNNYINIEKNELLIDPQTGTIKNEYKGINPLTGGLYEAHAKKQTNESPNNITIAEPGSFVITKKKSKIYKDAIDNNDQIAKDTILMNIRNHKIDMEGGLSNKKFANGGNIPNYLNPKTNPYSGNDILSGGGLGNLFGVPNGISNPIMSSTLGNNYNTQPVSNSNITSTYHSPNTIESSGFGKALDTLGKYAPALTNIGQGLFGNTYQQPLQTNLVNPYKNKILNNLPQDINLQPIINDVNNQARVADSSIQNNTNSSSVARANRQQLFANTSRQIAGVKMQGQQANNQIAAQRAGIYGQLGSEDIANQDRTRQLNLGITSQNNAAKANRQNILNTGISQFQQIGQNDKANSQKQALDKYNLQLMSQIFPNLQHYNNFDPETIFKQLGR